MKLLVISGTNSPHTRKWVLGLIEQGIEVHLFSLEPVLKEESWRAQLASHYAPSKKIKFLPKKYLQLFRALRTVLQTVQPTLVHVHYLTNYGLLAALSGAKPLVSTAWGSDVYEFAAKNSLTRSLFKLVLRRSDALISTSLTMRGEMQKYTSKNIEVIPFGIDLSMYSGSSATPDSTFKIAIFKRLEPVYGIDHALKAFAGAKAKLPNLPLELHVFGEGSLKNSLEQLSNELGIQQATFFRGWLEPTEVPAAHQEFSACMYLSSRESFGVALIEAMASNCFLVVSDIPAFREVGQEHDGIAYVQPSDTEAASQALLNFIHRSASRKQITEAARQSAIARYDLKNNIHSQIELYKRLLKQ